MKLASRSLVPGVFLGGIAFIVACAASKVPPRQANVPDEADPMADNSSSHPSSSSGGSGSKKGGGGNNAAGDPLPPSAGGKPTGKGGEAPTVTTVAMFMDGARWGTSHGDLTKQYTQTGGVIWKDYDEKLAKARVGPEQTSLEAEREQVKAAFSRSWIEFKDTPTGYDTTPIKAEFTYKNKEALMWVTRQGKKRYFFFINDRLWKVYDEVPLEEGGAMGATFADAHAKVNSQLGNPGRKQDADPAKGITHPTFDWKDGTTHLRLIDRSGDRLVGVVVEENGTLSNLAALRPNKMADPNEIDPSITAVTKGTNRSDPNAQTSASASGKKGAPPPPKKK